MVWNLPIIDRKRSQIKNFDTRIIWNILVDDCECERLKLISDIVISQLICPKIRRLTMADWKWISFSQFLIHVNSVVYNRSFNPLCTQWTFQNIGKYAICVNPNDYLKCLFRHLKWNFAASRLGRREKGGENINTSPELLM